MADKYNQVSAELTAEKAEEALSLIQQLRAVLPFLIALSKETRGGLTYPGAGGLEASASVLAAVQRRPELFPGIDAEEMKRDLALAHALAPISNALAGLSQGVDDTMRAAGSDSYRAALRASLMAQPHKATTPGLEAELAPMAAHLDRPRRS